MEQEKEGFKVSISSSSGGLMRWLIIVVLATLAIFLLVAAKGTYHQTDYPSRTISVSAEEKRVVRPGIGLISFTIHEENASLEVARNAEAKKSEALIAFLKKSGIEDRDIKTTSYTIYPSEEYDYRPCVSTDGASVICPPRKGTKKFVIEETVAVKVRKLDDIGKITTGATQAGVNQIGQLQFTVDDEVVERLKAEAREAAITKARAEAKTLAGNLGVRLGKLTGFSENGGMPVYYGRAMGMGGDMMEKSMAVPAPSIQPGENEIIASVNLTYEIK
ncbi:MAG: SIMPL domain-containing protein [Patescibacteria group bacterium]